MDGPLVVEKAVRPVDGKITWLVLDANLDPVDEVTRFALYLDGGGASANTVRAYVPRIARFLNWCHVQGVEWSNISLPQLILYKRGLEAELTIRRAREAHRNGLPLFVIDGQTQDYV